MTFRSLVQRAPWLRIALLVGIVYVGLGVVLYAVQTWLVFPATHLYSERDAFNAPSGVRVVELPSGTPMWVSGEHDRVVLMVHGNAEWVGNLEAGYRGPLRSLNTSFAAVEFRGVAGAPGPLSEAGLVQDVVLAIDALNELGWPTDRIVLHGRSIGGGIASRATRERDVAGLVLESSFDSLSAVVSRKFPTLLYPRFLLATPLRSDDALSGRDIPVFQVHDIYDTVVHVGRARALRDHLVDATVTETAGYPHGAPIVLSDERAHTEWREWLNETLPPHEEPTDGTPPTASP